MRRIKMIDMVINFLINGWTCFFTNIAIFSAMSYCYSRKNFFKEPFVPKLTTIPDSSKKRESMENARHNSGLEKKEKNRKAVIVNWVLWAMLFVDMICINNIIETDAEFSNAIVQSIIVFLIDNYGLAIIFYPLILLIRYRGVPENEEWTVSLFEEWFATWEAGPHFLFPFIEKISGKVFMGSQITTMYMDEMERNGEIDALIDFEDTSASVIARLFYRIFSAHRAIYQVEHFLDSVREKMDAGLRAHLGDFKLDKALKERANVNLDVIISQGATDAHYFKKWGAFIEGIAVTDIGLPDEVKEQRDLILKASKEQEAAIIIANNEQKVAIIKEKTAKHEAAAIRTLKGAEGSGSGDAIKTTASVSGLTEQDAAYYLLKEKYFKSIAGKGVIITDAKSDSNASMGAQIAVGMSMAKDELIPEKDEKPKKDNDKKSGEKTEKKKGDKK